MTIWVVITSTIHNRWGDVNPEKRRNEYYNAITSSKRNIPSNMRIIVVENSVSTNQSFLNDLVDEVVYTNHNSLSVSNKGTLEFLDLQAVIQMYNIPDDDIIVKLTGRYILMNPSFLQRIEDTESKYDAWVKFFNVCTLQFLSHDCVLGLYGIRVRILKQLNPYSIGTGSSMECDFAKFIRTHCQRIDEIRTLGLYCLFIEDGRTLSC